HGDGVVGHTLMLPADAQRAFLTGRSLCCGSKTYRGQPFLVFTAPLRTGGHVVAVVQTSISEHQYQQTTNSLLHALLVVALLGLLGSAVVSILLVGRALRPI